LRLKREISEIDSIYETFFGTGTWFGTPPTQTIEYEWIGQNKKDVLLKIVVANANGTDQIRTIEYQDIYLGLDASITENDFNATIFPNPTSEDVQVNSSTNLKQITINDSQGKLIKSLLNVYVKSYNLDLSD